MFSPFLPGRHRPPARSPARSSLAGNLDPIGEGRPHKNNRAAMQNRVLCITFQTIFEANRNNQKDFAQMTGMAPSIWALLRWAMLWSSIGIHCLGAMSAYMVLA